MSVQGRLLIVLAAAALVAGVGSVALAHNAPVPAALPAAPGGPPALPLATPRYFGSGGPYLGLSAALLLAHKAASGPVSRDEAHLMSYGDVVAWIGSENLYYDRGREMYVVAVSARYQGRGAGLEQPGVASAVCNSYFEVIDATDGTVLSIGCGGPSAWPSRLPAGFSR